MATRKKALMSAYAILTRELPGESAPTERSLQLLLEGCLAMNALEPWQALQDSNVFALDTESGQRWYCTVMGAGQEIYGFQAYRGDAGFALFDDIQNQRIKETAEFRARQDIFTLEFVRRTELTPLDRAILALSSSPIPPSRRVPQIRVGRPSQVPWYPTAEDAAEIQDCLMAALLFFEWLGKHPKVAPWAKKGELPLIVDWLNVPNVQRIPFPPRPVVEPQVVKLEERRWNKLLGTVPSRQFGHPVEVDSFLVRAPLRDRGRPYFPWAALACDSASGYLFPPVMSPGPREIALIDCLLGAILRGISKAWASEAMAARLNSSRT